ncbi:MAG: hypothetical protein KC652_02785 [Cyanobacteria bacterium HKST-UBA01]|nr:hypothetical protein [Cyanobacteria bacterium HKST-UBA01]
MSTQEVTVEDVSKQPEENGRWLSLQKASNATGLSMATLRRYIKRKKIESRRLGKTTNAKVQVYITADMLLESGKDDRISTEGLEEILSPETSDLDDDDNDESDIVEDNEGITADTLDWFKQQVEEKDELLQKLTIEKDKVIEELRMQLQAASYRNGYLEALKEHNEEKVRLLTEEKEALKLITERKDEEVDDQREIEDVPSLEQASPDKPGAVKKFFGWFMGSSA